MLKEKGGVNERMKFFQVKSVEETFSLIEEFIHPLTDKESYCLYKALNYILAEDIVVKENVPDFDVLLLMDML